MDSWSYVSQEKGFSFEESVSTPDLLAGSRNVLMGWEPRYHNSYNSNIQFSTPHVNENNHVNQELGSLGDVLRHSVFSAKEDSSSKIAGSLMESNGRGSLLIDLKLGRFIDHSDSVHKSVEGNNLSSSQSYVPSKRNRAAGLNAFCQVHGCNKDLTGSKDYHKRHKVCEAHSKTPKVIVNGIEQRFCQQCSRFHLLGEFDDGKRSCRKRLAGHNERRRKPQLGIHSGRSGRLLHSYNDILPGTLFHPEQYRANDWCKRIKIEDAIHCNPPSNNHHFHSKPVTPPYNFPKQYPHFQENCPSYCSRSFYHENSPVTEDLSSVFDTFSSTRRALSLLSSQSHNSSDYSSVIPMSQHVSQFHSPGHNNLNPILVMDNCGPGNFETENGKDGVSCEDGTTINLLQLSSQLQRVEHQRQSSIQEKPENDGFCCLRIT